MRAAIVALATMIALLTSVLAQSRKVLVLPLDGSAPAAQRTKVNEVVAQLTRDKIGGDVTVGDTTFDETAAAVGCNPAAPECAEQVRSTLGVDELVYGSANTADGSTTITVMRASAGAAPQSQISVLAETDSGDGAAAGLAPLFRAAGDPTLGSGSDALGSGSAVEPIARRSFFDSKERKLGVGIGAGGVILLVIGFSLWASASGLQDDIDNHPNETLAEIDNLRDLEDRAASKALQGNVVVVLGLAATGVGAYFLWKDRSNRRAATIAPAPVDSGAGMTFVLRGRW